MAYSDQWSVEFARERNALEKVIAPPVIDIHHFGGTAIVGCSSKPILDIAATIPALSQVCDILSCLRDLGYGHSWVYVLPDRVCLTKGNPVTHHLYFVDQTSHTLRLWLAFRDLLRKDESLRIGYTSLKRKLADEFPQNRNAYTQAKTDFILEALQNERK